MPLNIKRTVAASLFLNIVDSIVIGVDVSKTRIAPPAPWNKRRNENRKRERYSKENKKEMITYVLLVQNFILFEI